MAFRVVPVISGLFRASQPAEIALLPILEVKIRTIVGSPRGLSEGLREYYWRVSGSTCVESAGTGNSAS